MQIAALIKRVKSERQVRARTVLVPGKKKRRIFECE